jgi:DNA-binding transcriptional ArsR family regulator
VIRLTLTDSDVVATRIGASPLWETIGALLLLRFDEVPWPYRGWAASARPALAELDAAALAPLLGPQPTVPDAFLPQPDQRTTAIEDELERLRSAQASTVQAELRYELGAAAAGRLPLFFERPTYALDRFADALLGFWTMAIAPHWPAMLALIERDALRRARQVARSGAEAVFDDVHPRIRWRRPVLEIEKRWEIAAEGDGRGVVFVPLVFSRAAMLFSIGSGGPAVSYPVRGTSTLWQAPGAPDDRLDLLLGAGRAAVLRELVQPSTTSDLAARLRLAPSSVSHHLSVLRRAEVVDRQRVDRHVVYQLNAAGRALTGLTIRR